MTTARRQWLGEGVALLVAAVAFFVMSRTIANFNWILAFLLFVVVRACVAGLSYAVRARRRAPASRG